MTIKQYKHIKQEIGSKEYGLNIGYISLNKEKFDEIKSYFLENCTKEELYIAVDDEEWLLDRLLKYNDSDWLLDNLSAIDKEELFSSLVEDVNSLSKRQLTDLKDSLSYYNDYFVMPTDNLNDLSKAEFILENWDKIKIENIKL